MTSFVLLLRAVNVGGTGALKMAELVRLCEECGLKNSRTYIQSGNVVCESSWTEQRIKAALEKALEAHVGKPVGVMVRSAGDLRQILARNPYKKAPPNRVIVFLMDTPPGKLQIEAPAREEVEIIGREAYVHYPDGQGTSKLKLPFANVATGRNLNTLTKLLAMASGSSDGD